MFKVNNSTIQNRQWWTKISNLQTQVKQNYEEVIVTLDRSGKDSKARLLYDIKQIQIYIKTDQVKSMHPYFHRIKSFVIDKVQR